MENGEGEIRKQRSFDFFTVKLYKLLRLITLSSNKLSFIPSALFRSFDCKVNKASPILIHLFPPRFDAELDEE